MFKKTVPFSVGCNVKLRDLNPNSDNNIQIKVKRM